MVLLTSSQSPVADLTSTMYCRTRSKALDWFQVTCNDVSMIVVMVTSEGATGTKTKIHQLLYVKQTQKLFLWPITKCADNPRNQSEPEARHVAGATGGKCASRQLAAATSDWLIRWHDVFQPITKLRFTQPNQSPHFQNCLCPTLSNPLHYYYDLSIHKSLYLSVVIVTLCKTMPHDQFKSAFIPYK